MKLSITINDLTVQTVTEILAKLGSPAVTSVTQFSPDVPVNLIQPKQNENETGDAGHNANDLDADGFPWNGKIHSSNEKKTAKGVWTRKRGVEDSEIAHVEAEMRASGFGQVLQNTTASSQVFTPNYPTPPVYAQQPVAPIQDRIERAEAAMGIRPQPQAPNYGAPVYAPQPVAQVAPVQQQQGPIDFNGLMMRISTLFQTQQITPDYLTGLAQRIGQAFGKQVNAITDIAGDPVMIDYALQVMRADGKVA